MAAQQRDEAGRLGTGRYLVRVVSGTVWFLLMGAFTAAVVWAAVSLVVGFGVDGAVMLVLLALVIGLPIRRQWIVARHEVFGLFRRTPSPERSTP